MWHLDHLPQHLPCPAPPSYQAVWTSKTCCTWFPRWGLRTRLQPTHSPVYQLALPAVHCLDGIIHSYAHMSMYICEELKDVYTVMRKNWRLRNYNARLRRACLVSICEEDKELEKIWRETGGYTWKSFARCVVILRWPHTCAMWFARCVVDMKHGHSLDLTEGLADHASLNWCTWFIQQKEDYLTSCKF